MESVKPSSASEIFENADLPRIRIIVRTFCALCIVCWALYHVSVFYGLYGFLIFLVLLLITYYLAEENVCHEKLVYGERILIVVGTLICTLYHGGLIMIPLVILLLATLITIEFLYKTVQELKERMERVECDVSYLFDENAADEYGGEEDEPVAQGITRNQRN